MNKQKQSKPLSWKPVLRGAIYCAPACGAGCTRIAYLEAQERSRVLLGAMKSKGWKADVWENLGWHYAVRHKGLGVSIHEDLDQRKSLVYSAAGPAWLVEGEGGSRVLHAANPNVLVRVMARRIKESISDLQQMYLSLGETR